MAPPATPGYCNVSSCVTNISPTIMLPLDSRMDAANCSEIMGRFGDVSRVDFRTVEGTEHMLVTYYDVRSASAALMNLNGKACFVPMSNCASWAVKITVADFVKQQLLRKLHGFGDVSCVRPMDASVVIEFCDLRAASDLIASLKGKGVPCTACSAFQSVDTEHKSVQMASNGAADESYWMHCGAQGPPPPDTLPLPLFISQGQTQTGGVQRQTSDGGSVPNGMSEKEYAQFDIDPAKIESGEDSRTTVMIRHLTGTQKRSDLLEFLQKWRLESRHNFFYVPCKRNRNVYAGFAFVNLLSPQDVLTLRNAVMTQPWRSNSSEKGVKMLAVSYAKIQGLDELRAHFSSSIVAKELHPKKRPIFRAINSSNPARSPASNAGHSTVIQSCPSHLFTNIFFDDESPPSKGHVQGMQLPNVCFEAKPL